MQVDPEQFAISVTSIDGQHFSIGDSDTQFCIQSCSKPISYLCGLKEFGTEYVHKHVGTEPSGHAFNEMILKKAPTEEKANRAIPHNPCINAGAIMAVSMVFPDKTMEERHKQILDVWKDLSGGDDAPIGYDEETYLSESGSADRNWCLGYMMKESGAFPPCFTNLRDTLELYFQICSTLSTCKAMSIMASTLANGGLNPITGMRCFSADHVRSVLPIMVRTPVRSVAPFLHQAIRACRKLGCEHTQDRLLLIRLRGVRTTGQRMCPDPATDTTFDVSLVSYAYVWRCS